MKELFEQTVEHITLYGAKVPIVVVCVLLGGSIIKLAQKAASLAMTKAKVEPTVTNLFLSIGGFIGWVTVAATVFGILGLTQVSIAFSGSIALIAMGLASSASGIVSDLLAGIYLIADPDFKVGRRVKVGNIEGTVTSVDIRKTKVKDDEGNLQVLPNKTIDSATYTIRNFDKIEKETVEESSSQ